MTKLIAFHGDPAVKDKYVNRVEQHRLADELIRGTGWDGHKGCAVGCSLEKYDHAAYETEMGIPTVLAHLEDAIFEGLPQDKAMLWPGQFLSTIQTGADLELVSAHFMVWLLEDELKQWSSPESSQVVALYRRRINKDEPSEAEWLKAAEAAAEAAAWAAAEAAWAAQAARAARAAAEAAAEAAWAAAEAACYERMAANLLELLAEAK